MCIRDRLDRIVVYHKDSEKVSGVIERNKESIMGDVLALEMTEGEGEGYTKAVSYTHLDVYKRQA